MLSTKPTVKAGMSISLREAGRKGGLTVLRKRGRAFFVEIGQKGQLAMQAKYPGMASQWGKLGGRPKKPCLKEMGGGSKPKRKEASNPPHKC